MIQEYSEYLLEASCLSQKFGDTFHGVQFDEQTQAIEVFLLQALAMCTSQCSSSAFLLQNDFAGEAALVLRSIEELLFDIHWMKEPTDRKERLERVYRLEADPMAQWIKETNLIANNDSVEKAKIFKGPIDDIATKYAHLTKTNADGSKSFKTLKVSLADRMGQSLRPLYYHVYRYGSLFTHPTPFIKNLYLKESNSHQPDIEFLYESHKQFIAYSLMFVGFIIGYVEEMLGSFTPDDKGQRDIICEKMIQLIEKANKGYFYNPLNIKAEN